MGCMRSKLHVCVVCGAEQKPGYAIELKQGGYLCGRDGCTRFYFRRLDEQRAPPMGRKLSKSSCT